MKQLLFFAALICTAGYFYNQSKSKADSEDAAANGPITNPVFGAHRYTISGDSRSIEMGLFIQHRNREECEKNKELMRAAFAQGWKFKSMACESNLDARYLKMFSNQPGRLTYISFSPVDPREREARGIFWGTTEQESVELCRQFSSRHSQKGAVKCVAPR